jgi:DNA-binding transcriptional ArsR family regulator
MSLQSTLIALADDTRRASIDALARGPLSAGELAGRLRVSPAALTGHLRVLRTAGLVSVALDPADSRRHLYSIEPGPLSELSEWAAEATRFWGSQLESFARLSRRTNRARG